MSSTDQTNLKHLLAIVRDGATPDPRLSWSRKLDEDLGAWRKGKPGSINSARYSNAIRAAADPEGAARWWLRMLALEAGQGHNGPEPLSGIYWGWSLVAEVAAQALFYRRPSVANQHAADELEKSINRHVALAALCGAGDVEIRSRRVLYRGPVTLGPGARSDDNPNRTVHSVFAACLGIIPTFQQKGVVAELAAALSWTCLRPANLVRQCRAIIGAPVSNAAKAPPLRAAVQALADGPLKGCRLVVPFEFHLWKDGRRLALMRRNPNGNTGAVYAAHLPPGIRDASEAELLYPYGDEPRVRSKDLIGAGSCWRSAGSEVWAENMTPNEESHKRLTGRHPRRYTDRITGLPPDPDISVEIGPDGISLDFFD